jgi:hypothetical protein
MPRYFFDMEDSVLADDTLGVDLVDFDAVKATAVRVLADSLRRSGNRFWDAPEWRLVVSDERGLTLFILDLAATMAPASPHPSLLRSQPGPAGT